MSIADELAKLAELKKQGLLTDEEFNREKAKLLGTEAAPTTSVVTNTPPELPQSNTKPATPSTPPVAPPSTPTPPTTTGNQPSGTSPHGFWKVFLCSLFFGSFGVDHFITGKIKTGIVKLVTFGGCGIWTLTDWIILLTNQFRDSEHMRIVNKHPKTLLPLLSAVIFIPVLVLIICAAASDGGSSGSGRSVNGKWECTSQNGSAEIRSGISAIVFPESQLSYVITKLGEKTPLHPENPKDKSWEAVCVVEVYMAKLQQKGLYGPSDSVNSPGMLTYTWSETPGDGTLTFKSVGTGDTYTFKRKSSKQ
ncbi:MAG: NINE protein [Verrucomicrobiia bacterium]